MYHLREFVGCFDGKRHDTESVWIQRKIESCLYVYVPAGSSALGEPRIACRNEVERCGEIKNMIMIL